MADSFQLRSANYSYQLVYDASTQTEYKMMYGGQVGQPMPNVLIHSPDSDSGIPVRAWDTNRTAYFTLDVIGDDWDEVFDSIATLKRMVHGASSQALRYQIAGDDNRVVLRVRMTGATNYVDIPVLYGSVDDSQSFYKADASINKRARGVVISLVLEPHGEGAEQTLVNDIPSSPHCVEDSNSDGLADGWTLTNTPTTAIATTYYLAGGKSQRFAVDASTNEGIISPAATCTTSDEIAAYVWVMANPADTPDDLTIQLTDGTLVEIDSATYTAASPTGYDKSWLDIGGRTWYRYSFSDDGSPVRSNANAKIRVRRGSGDATKISTYWVDCAYIQVGTTTIPDAFCSTSAIENRYDPTASNESRINYLDVWGVPGDADAVATIEYSSSSARSCIFGQMRDGKHTVTEKLHWNDSLSGSGPQWGTTADAARSGGEYHTYNDNDSDATAIIGSNINFTTYPGTSYPIWRVYALSQVSNTAITLSPQVITGANTTTNETYTYPSTGTWYAADCGLCNIKDFADNYDGTTQGFTFRLNYDVSGGTYGAGSIKVDALMFIPVDYGALWGEFSSTQTSFAISGDRRSLLKGSSGAIGDPYLGKMWTVASGNRTSRIITTLLSATNFTHSLTVTSDTQLTIIPKSTHLIGTK